MKKLTLTIAALLIVISSFANTITHIHEYTYSYSQSEKGEHLKNGIKESKKGFRLIGITYNEQAKTVTYSYTDSKNIETVNVYKIVKI